MLVAAIVVQALTAPGQTVGVSVFVDHLVTDLDLSRSSVSAAYLVGTLTGAASMPAAGRFIDRAGLRNAITAFGLAFGLVLVAMAGVQGIITLTIGFAATRMLGQGALSLTASTAVAVWYDRNRGTMMGLKAAIGGAAMSLIPIAAAASIAAFGWRTTWMLLGVTVASTVPVLGWFFFSNPAPQATVVPLQPDHADHQHDWTTREIVRTARFWVVTTGIALSALVGTALVFHQITLLTDRGLTPTQAAANFLPQTLAAAGGALLAGRLADRISPRLLVPTAIAMIGVAPALLLAVTGPGLAVIAYALALGASGGAIRTLEGTLLPTWFGTRHIGEVRGVVMAAAVGASALGPFLLAAGHELFDSYVAVFVSFSAAAVLSAAAAVVGVPARRPAHQPLS